MRLLSLCEWLKIRSWIAVYSSPCVVRLLFCNHEVISYWSEFSTENTNWGWRGAVTLDKLVQHQDLETHHHRLFSHTGAYLGGGGIGPWSPPPQESKFYFRYRFKWVKILRTTINFPKNKVRPPPPWAISRYAPGRNHRISRKENSYQVVTKSNSEAY